MSETYMQYICKNPACARIFLWLDLGRWPSPQTWRYCDECEDEGLATIREKPKSKDYEARKRRMDDANIDRLAMSWGWVDEERLEDNEEDSDDFSAA